MQGPGVGVSVSGQDMFGAGAAVAGIADEASEVLNELDRPIIRKVITHINKRHGKVTRDEFTLSKLDIVFGILIILVIGAIRSGQNPFQFGGIFDMFKGLFMGGWGGGVGSGLSQIYNGTLNPYREIDTQFDKEAMIDLFDIYKKYRQGTATAAEEAALKGFMDNIRGSEDALKKMYETWLEENVYSSNKELLEEYALKKFGKSFDELTKNEQKEVASDAMKDKRWKKA